MAAFPGGGGGGTFGFGPSRIKLCFAAAASCDDACAWEESEADEEDDLVAVTFVVANGASLRTSDFPEVDVVVEGVGETRVGDSATGRRTAACNALGLPGGGGGGGFDFNLLNEDTESLLGTSPRAVDWFSVGDLTLGGTSIVAER